MNTKFLLLALVGVSAFTYGLYVATTQSTLEAKPENVHACENKDYVLVLKDFGVDKDLAPGATVSMKSTFTPKASGAVDRMAMIVYLGSVKIWTQNVDKHFEFTANQEFTYDYTITLPSVIPHLHVIMKMDFQDAAHAELSCLTFDLHL